VASVNGADSVRVGTQVECHPAHTAKAAPYPGTRQAECGGLHHRTYGWGVSVALGTEVVNSARSDRVQEHLVARTRGGKRFLPIAERKLDPILRDLAARLPGASAGVIVISEMSGPTGLPDLVALPITPRLRTRLALACPPVLAWGDARLAAACSSSRPLSERLLARRLDVAEGAVHRRARRLEDSGALLSAGRGWIRPQELQPVGRLYALEAKVDDWNAGLGQALRYGSWADASAAVMAQLPRDPSRVIAQASQLGLGLALGQRWLVRPKIRRLTLAHRLWASEHLIAALGIRVD